MSLLIRPFLFDSFYDDELISMRHYFDVLQNKIKYKNINNNYIYEFNVAGIPKEKINITLDRLTYTIKIDGKIDESNDEETECYAFSRSINQSVIIPKDSDLENIRSELNNGILKIIIKKQALTSNKQTITIN